MIQQYTQQNKIFFYTILVILGALGLWLVSGYLGVIVFSLVMVIILKPVYNFFERLLGGRAGLATTATIVALFLAIIVPSWITLRIVTNQVNTISESGEPLTLEDFQNQVNDLIEQVPFADQLPYLDELELTDEELAKINFGFFGVIYGPVLMMLVVTTIEVYGQYYASQPSLAPSATGEVNTSEISNDSPATEKVIG